MSRSILVRAPNWLGDVVMCTPAFRALRDGFPNDRIELLARPELLALLQGSPWFDALHPLRSYHRGAVAMWREARALRAARRFDLGICIPDSWSSALLLRAAGVRRLAGYTRAGRGFLLDDALPPPPDAGPRRLVAREHYALALVEAVGAPARGTGLELFTTDAEERHADQALAEVGGRDFLAVAPGASYGSAKRWPPASFARVADALAERGHAICLVGAPGEEAVSAAVAASMRAPVLDLTGRLDLGALKAVLRRAAALLCNDAGTRHVAVAFGVPAVVLMGPTSLAKTDCNLERVRVIETDVDCRPCYQRTCPIDHRCMTGIDAARVRDVLLEQLEGRSRGMPERGRREGQNAGT